jgi:Ser/Thr protein kinase RdoA (MazF antagonist)
MQQDFKIPRQVFIAYKDLGEPIEIMPINMGLINKTFLVKTNAKKYILQELSKIFEVTVNEDSETVSNFLSNSGILTPQIYRTHDDQLFLSINGRIFRALKYIEGKSFHTIKSLAMAKSAGKIIGQFHLALIDFDYSYKSRRRHGGDYWFHKKNLLTAIHNHRNHDYFFLVAPLAKKMLTAMDSLLMNFSPITPRHVHGDPKISNIIFDDQEQATGLVDFDTLSNTGWSLEIADAMRSWCNPNKEDVLESFIDLKIAANSLEGYGSIMRGKFSTKEKNEFLIHTRAITLCLAIRYLTDVLNENYWSFDHKLFYRPAEHNLLRAQAMYNLFLEFEQKNEVLFEMISDFLS